MKFVIVGTYCNVNKYGWSRLIWSIATLTIEFQDEENKLSSMDIVRFFFCFHLRSEERRVGKEC